MRFNAISLSRRFPAQVQGGGCIPIGKSESHQSNATTVALLMASDVTSNKSHKAEPEHASNSIKCRIKIQNKAPAHTMRNQNERQMPGTHCKYFPGTISSTPNSPCLPRQSVPHSRPPKATWTKIECTFSAHARTISEWRMWPPSLWLLCIWLTRTTKLRYPQHIVDNLAGGVRKSQENLRTAVLYVEHFSQLASKEIKLLAKIPGICRNRLCRASLWVHTQRKVLSLQGHNIVILIFLFVFRLQNSPFHSDILST